MVTYRSKSNRCFNKLKLSTRNVVILLLLVPFIAIISNFRGRGSVDSSLHTTSDRVYDDPQAPHTTPGRVYDDPQAPRNIPHAFSEIYPIARPEDPKTPPPYTTPQILSIYKRRQTAASPVHDLLIYAAGIMIGPLRRNITILGCLVGNVAYPGLVSPYDVIRCTVPEPPSSDVAVSLLLLNDAVLQEALTFKSVNLGSLSVTLPQDVIVDSPEDVKLLKDGSLEELGDDETKVVASNFTWSTFPTEKIAKDKMKSSPRHRLCLITMVKPFAESLEPWVLYHRKVGVDKVFIMDNLAKHSIADDFEGREDVEVIYWPFVLCQIQGLTYMLHALRARCEWVLPADLDEFMMPGLEGAGNIRPLSWFLRNQASRGIELSKFGFISMVGNRTTRPKEPMPLAYIHAATTKPEKIGKAACRSDVEWGLQFVHTCLPEKGHVVKIEKGPGKMEPSHASNLPSVVHYRYRSWEEFVLKRRIGSGSTLLWFTKKEDEGEEAEKYPKWFGELPKKAQVWTFFRERYQLIMERYDENLQTIVWEEAEKQCEFTENRSKGWKSETTCWRD